MTISLTQSCFPEIRFGLWTISFSGNVSPDDISLSAPQLHGRVRHLLDSPRAWAFCRCSSQPTGQPLVIPTEAQGLWAGAFGAVWKPRPIPHSSLKNKQFHGHYSHKLPLLSHQDRVGAWIIFSWIRMLRQIQTKTYEKTSSSSSHFWDGFVGEGSSLRFRRLTGCSLGELEKFLTWGLAFLSELTGRRFLSKQIVFPLPECLNKFLLTWTLLAYTIIMYKQSSDFSKIWRKEKKISYLKNPLKNEYSTYFQHGNRLP